MCLHIFKCSAFRFADNLHEKKEPQSKPLEDYDCLYHSQIGSVWHDEELLAEGS